MPTYEYKCESCGHLEEVFAKMSDPPPAACQSCGAAELVKVLFPVAVHYKGSGFYSTDYKGAKPAAATSGSGSGGDSGSSAEATSSSESGSGRSFSSSDSGSSSSSSSTESGSSGTGTTSSSASSSSDS